MKISKNKKLDVAYIQFRSEVVSKTLKLRDDLLIDLDKKGRIVGIEVLSLSSLAPTLKVFSKASLSKLKALHP